MAGRKGKNVVDYFPHYCTHGKTIFILENKYGMKGYCVWFKTLELLGRSENHFIDCRKKDIWEYLAAYMKLPSDELSLIYDTLADLNAIHPELWDNRVIWSLNFLEGIKDVYKRRNNQSPMLFHELAIKLNIPLKYDYDEQGNIINSSDISVDINSISVNGNSISVDGNENDEKNISVCKNSISVNGNSISVNGNENGKNDENGEGGISVDGNSISVDINSISVDINSQSKVKYSKEKKIYKEKKNIFVDRNKIDEKRNKENSLPEKKYSEEDEIWEKKYRDTIEAILNNGVAVNQEEEKCNELMNDWMNGKRNKPPVLIDGQWK